MTKKRRTLKKKLRNKNTKKQKGFHKKRRLMSGGAKEDYSKITEIFKSGTWNIEEDMLDELDPNIYDFIEYNVDTTLQNRKEMKRAGIPTDEIINSYRRDYSYINGITKSNFVLVNEGLRNDKVDPAIEPIVKNLDLLFNNENTPKFAKTTILFRGGNLDFEYQQVVIDKEPLQKAFISTSKRIDSLFNIIPLMEMLPNYKLKAIPIVINILIVDPGISYIDLYNENSRGIDQLQDEILLERGLTFEYAASSTYSYYHKKVNETVVNPVHVFYVHKSK